MRFKSVASDRDLDVAELGPNLKTHAVRSGAAVVVGQAGVALIGLGAVAVLARLLQPADFGLVAMALPIIVIATVLRSFGLDVGTIYREQLDATLVNSVFWTSLALNFSLTLVLAALAPILAWFYGEPRLVKLTIALAGGALLLNLGAQPETLLKRQMRFHWLAFISLVAALTGAVVAVVMAKLGAGYWALAFQTIVTFLVRSLLAWVFCDWRPSSPRAVRSDARLRAMLASGRNLTSTRLLHLSASYFDRVIVGWLGGAAVLGLYENGRRIAFLALDTLYAPLLDVGVAGFSRASRDGLQYRAFGIKAVQLVLALMLPSLIFLLLEVRPITLVLLGKQWLPAVPYARWLIGAALAQSLSRTLMWFYLSTDRTAQQMRWFTMQSAVLILSVTIGAWLGGVYGVAVAVAVATWTLTIPAIIYGLRESPFSAGDFAGASAWPILFSLAAAVCLLVWEWIAPWSWTPLNHCLSAAGIYFLIYVGVWFVSPGSRAAGRQILQLLLKR